MKHKTTILAALAGCILLPSSLSAYEPAGDGLITRWGKEVTPENAWRSYPRPRLERSQWLNLNGIWNCSVTPSSADITDAAFDREILVPFCIESSLSGIAEAFTPDDRLWYKREFTLDPAWKGRNIILHFGAVDYQCEVFVDGKSVGTHTGGNNAFSFDITKALKGKGPHTLVVSVTDPTDTTPATRGKQKLKPNGIWYTPVSGIWKTVWIEPVGSAYIENVMPQADVDSRTVTFSFSAKGLKGGESVKVVVKDGTAEIASAEGLVSESLTIAVPDACLWTSSSPKLYGVEISLMSKGREVDYAESYFAMREVSKMKDGMGYERFALNGTPLFQFGPLDQGWWPDGLLTPPSEEAMLWDMVQLKNMGFNTLRKHIKVEPELYYYYADSLGLMVWQDMPSGFDSSKASEQHVSAASTHDWDAPQEVVDQWKYEYAEMVSQLSFYPCITTWVVFNEGWGQHNTAQMTEYALSMANGRLVNSVSGWADRNVGDYYDIHNYPSTAMIPAEETSGRISALGEFGGLSLPVSGHMLYEGKGWGYRSTSRDMDLMADYSRLVYDLELLVPQGLSAAIYTQTTDVEKEVNGLITYDREVIKLPEEVLSFMHGRLYNLAPVKADVLVPVLRNGKVIDIPVKDSAESEAEFSVDKAYGHLSLLLNTSGHVKVWINGKEVHSAPERRTKTYNQYNLSHFTGYLRPGKNMIKVSVDNNTAKDTILDFGLKAF